MLRCIKCECFKPERTHHCSRCEVCILGMDHHCRFLGNCIGFYTRKSYILMLFYLMLSLVPSIIVLPLEGSVAPSLLSLVILPLVILFFYPHIKGVLANRTTIEMLAGINKYPGSSQENWTQVFGENRFIWAFPFIGKTGLRGNGVEW